MVGCKSNQQKAGMAESNAKPTVTVTIPPYKYFVEKIAGDKVDVNVMVSNGNNPETYEPNAQQMMELSNSALYLKVGSIGFEQTWIKKLQDNAPDMKLIDTSVGITPAKTPGGNIDPHVWMSCKNARIISSNIFKALCQLEPENKTFFQKNYQQLLSSIDRQDSIIRKSFKDNPEMVRKFVIYHPILTYFARDYQLEQLAIEEEGREPSAAQLKSLIERARKQKIRYCLIQAEFANRNTTTFIKESQTKAMDINPLQADWANAMKEVSLAVQGKKIVAGK
jgi:zinc transport system substrate-binding protein